MLPQQIQDAWQHIVEFFKHPTPLTLVVAGGAILAVLGGLGVALKGISGNNVYGALLEDAGDLANSASVGINHNHAAAFLWAIVVLSTCLLIALIATLTLSILLMRSRNERNHVISDLNEARQKEEVFKLELDVSKENVKNERRALTQMEALTRALQQSAEFLLGEAETSRRVFEEFLFRPNNIGQRIVAGVTAGELFTEIRTGFNEGRVALRRELVLANGVATLLNGDKELADQLVPMIQRSISRDMTATPDSLDSKEIDRRTRRLFEKALKTFEDALTLAGEKLKNGDALACMSVVLDGREEAARKITDSKEPSIEALTKLLAVPLHHTCLAIGADRGFIFVPDGAAQSLVRCASTPLSPAEMASPSIFYIGNSADRLSDRGVAGYAYTEREPVICNWNEERSRFEDKYMAASQHPRSARYSRNERPEYKSFIAIPLFRPLLWGAAGNAPDTSLEGVVCFDARDPLFFAGHDLMNAESAYLNPSSGLLRVIFKLVQWRGRVRLSSLNGDSETEDRHRSP